jgi:CRISPR-associated endoribonuclease Cas6
MLIERYELNLLVEDKADPFLRSPARGALMHGLLLNSVDTNELHSSSGLRPFSQNLINCGESQYIWTINLLHEVQAAPIKTWLETHPERLFVEHYQSHLSVLSLESKKKLSYEQLLADALSELPPKYVSFEFLTPLIFKKAGVRAPWPYPEARMIMQSVFARWNQFSDLSKFEDEQIFEDVCQYVSPQFLKIHSQNVAMDGVMFAGTTGSASFNIQKTELRQLMHLAGLYSEYCGVGAKTAMGLGAVRYRAGLLSRKSKTASAEISVLEPDAQPNVCANN